MANGVVSQADVLDLEPRECPEFLLQGGDSPVCNNGCCRLHPVADERE